MNESNEIILYYIHDPMCSWCYAFRSSWKSIKQSLPENINIRYVVGGLAPDSDEPMPEEMKSYLIQTWHRIQEKVPGTTFNFTYWQVAKPRRSTYPACRAVLLSGDKYEEMLEAIQDAYYQQAKNPSDVETLIGLAEELGLDANKFKESLNGNETQQMFDNDLNLARSLGVNSFPSLVLQKDGENYRVPADYNNPDTTIYSINQIIN